MLRQVIINNTKNNSNFLLRYREGVGKLAKFERIRGMVFLSPNTIAVTDAPNQVVRLIYLDRRQTERYAGADCSVSPCSDAFEGHRLDIRLHNPTGIAYDPESKHVFTGLFNGDLITIDTVTGFLRIINIFEKDDNVKPTVWTLSYDFFTKTLVFGASKQMNRIYRHGSDIVIRTVAADKQTVESTQIDNSYIGEVHGVCVLTPGLILSTDDGNNK